MSNVRQRFYNLRLQTLQLSIDNYENELKAISKELFHRYSSNDGNIGTHLDELTYDFMSTII